MSLSELAATARASATMALNARAKALVAEGVDVVNFTIGEPDFDTPDNIKQAAHLAIQSGFTKYQPAAGLPELRRAVARKLAADNGLDYSPDEVLISNGAKQALYMTMLVLLQQGDEVVVPAPYWVSYIHQARFCGARVALVDATGTLDLKPTPELLKAAITERSRALVLNSPCNPTGVVLSRDELRALLEAALEKDLWIISDEIYEKLVYDEAEHVSSASLGPQVRERVVTINGLSKTYAMTGWRIGYAAGPPEVIQAAGRLQSHMTSGADSIAQRAAVEALEGPQESVEEMREAFDERRHLLVEGLNELPGVSCLMPRGAFYAFPDCRGLLGRSYGSRRVENSLELCEALLDQAQVAAVPGSAFGAEGFVRFHYAKSDADIKKALERLGNFAAAGQD
ncbi:MAG: aspartate aminotransferase [Planctomycetes bacterium SM23_32]|nr:MAG: aspartate aminotransferase [Planctomycetes bacterium SM23_32]